MIANELDIRYFDVEKHLIEYIHQHKIAGNDLPKHGFDIEEIEIRTILDNENAIIFEATGSSEYFMHYYNMYSVEFNVIPIKLECSFETCLDRIIRRNHTDNFEVSVEKISEIYDRSTTLELDWFQIHSTENNIIADELIGKLEKEMRA